ncbi:hypothetical protein BH769_gp42 [Gordonia phage BritBrat]|uniref:Uncharacterized protein n=1 Tax=Gordonia phage BritBrat TaxID=1838064 RepID=A0A166Y174_9CAUD|nr:hypothetical protein BH769_gp42 [Gordonia phage BritBrat]ANA85302.1 hypothetical protein PBI_BRITBRAT_42 [Gordonia phage BritBrat]
MTAAKDSPQQPIEGEAGGNPLDEVLMPPESLAERNRDPLPWVHVSEPGAPRAPRGGYTFSPREGYGDHGDRFEPRGPFRPRAVGGVA